MSKFFPANWLEQMDRLCGDVNRAFERWVPGHPRGESGAEDSPAPSFWNACSPVVDMEEDESEIRVTAELPGLDRDDFAVEVVGDRLILRGEKKVERDDKKRDQHYRECRYGSFYRALPLPCEVEADKIAATYKNGVLNLRIPKSETAKPRTIKVDIS